MKKIVNILLFIIIAFFLYFCYFKYIKKVNYIAFGDYRLYTLVGNSMAPDIKDGDAILVKKAEQFEKGDIVCYEAYSITNIRKIKDITEKGFVVQETYTGSEDLIGQHQIIGKMTKKISKMGHVLQFLTQPFTFLFVGILIGTYFVFVYNHERS